MALLEWQDLKEMPTLHVGQYADLKIDTGTMRVWVSRMRIHDGETQPVQVERLRDGRWEDVTAPPDGHSTQLNDIDLDGAFSGMRVQTITRRFPKEV